MVKIKNVFRQFTGGNMADLIITDSHGWIVEVVRAAVSWIYSRQATEARMISFAIKGENYKTFHGVFVIGIGTVSIKGKELGLTDIREPINNMVEYSGSLIISTHNEYGREYLHYDMKGSNIIVQRWEDDLITEEYQETPLE